MGYAVRLDSKQSRNTRLLWVRVNPMIRNSRVESLNCESVSASEGQDEEQMPRETGTRHLQGTHTEGRTPQSTHDRRRGPHRGSTQNTHRHTGDPYRTHTDNLGTWVTLILQAMWSVTPCA